MGTLKEMLDPASVALIGATDREGSVGRAVLRNLLSGASARPLYPVNPGRRSVLGMACHRSINEVPTPVDLAIIVTPARTVPAIVRECGESGVRGAIILSAGFNRAAPERTALEKEVVDAHRTYGMRIVGPNCLGVIVPATGLNATFLTANPEPGNIALVSRALGDAVLDWAGAVGIGFSIFASLGLMLDVGYGDIIDALSGDRNTKSMMVHMETVGDARRFISAARGFALKKPMVVLKPGRSEAGAALVAARTGGNAGDDRVYDAVFKRLGLVRVMEGADLLNVAAVLDSSRLPPGPRLAIVTNAGDVGILAADALALSGGELAKVSKDLVNEIGSFLPSQWERDDPIDIAGNADADRHMRSLEACLDDDGVDGALLIYTPRAAPRAVDLSQGLIELSRKTAKPVIVTWVGGDDAAEGRRFLLKNNVPAYATPEEAVRTYLYMYHYRRNIELLYETPAELSQADPPLKNYLRRVIGKAIDDGQRLLRTEHALDFLKNYGIPSVAMVVVTDASRIVRKARELGFPVQMTVRYLYDDRADETVWVTSEREADGVCHEVKHAVARPPGATGTDAEVVIRRAADPGGYRLRLVSTRDPEFRTVIMLGPGEASSHEVSIGLPPLNQTLARRLLEGVHLLGALRSSETGQVALSRLEGILLGFSNLIVDFAEIERVELDLSVREPEVLVEDVKVAPSFERDGSSPYRHLVITPYPTHYVTSWRLPDGTEVLIRPVRPEDEPMSREMFSAVSGETLRVRFFNVVDVTHELLMRFCNIDYEREIAVLAEIRKADRKIMIGGSRLIGEPDSKRGQFAVLVHDDYQGIGLGSKLIDVIIGIAQEKGLHEIHGLVLSENDRMLGLCRKLGFEVRAESDGLSRVILSLRDR